jgi:hypothetical protein
MQHFSQKVLNRFGSKVDFKYLENGQLDHNVCWEWKSSKNPNGYGTFWYIKSSILAHRFAYEAEVDDIPYGLEVCHSCDNHACVNPSHLSPETHDVNMKDMVNKNRQSQGDNHKKSVLTNENAKKILINVYNGEYKSISQIKKIYGVGKTTIVDLLHGKNWKPIVKEIEDLLKIPVIDLYYMVAKPRMDDDMINYIRELISQGQSASSIARQLGFARNTISNIKKCISWAEVP